MSEANRSRQARYGNARFVARTGGEKDLEAPLLGLIAPTRAEAGNIDYDLFVAKDNRALFYVHESWRDQAAVQTHSRQPHARTARSVLAEILAEAFTVGFGALAEATPPSAV